MAIVKIIENVIEQALLETNWAALDAQTDEDIARNTASDPDAPPMLSETATVAAFTKSIRQKLALSQPEFAARFHIPLGTLRDWEQGRAQPDSPAIAYLRVIASKAEMVAEVLAK